MRKLAILTFTVLFSMFCIGNTQATGYTVNEDLIDQMFAAAPESSIQSLGDLSLSGFTGTTESLTEPSAPVAILLDFFLGGLGVHRFYLGTEVLTGLLYPITCGGFFGVVPLIDFVVLIINIEDISQFVDNPKFFMW